IIRITPTGITTNNIESGILYSLLKLPFGIRSLINLEGHLLTTLQNNFHNFKYFIINEKSILSIKNIYFINNYLH
ncbi:hypothetical protein QBC45DRAFT_318412, partial [Copromyces sp. CBS 386.78]